MWQQSVQTNWNPENFSPVCFRPDNSLSFSSAVHITVYIFIGSQIELKIETAVSQKLNFTPRGRVLNFPIQIWERATSETENLYFKCRKFSSIQLHHQLNFLKIEAIFLSPFLKMKTSVEFERLWFDQIWLAEKLDRDRNLWTWFGKNVFCRN